MRVFNLYLFNALHANFLLVPDWCHVFAQRAQWIVDHWAPGILLRVVVLRAFCFCSCTREQLGAHAKQNAPH